MVKHVKPGDRKFKWIIHGYSIYNWIITSVIYSPSGGVILISAHELKLWLRGDSAPGIHVATVLHEKR